MGNIVALDMGIVIMRVAIFDAGNRLFPYKVQQKLRKYATEKRPHLYFMSDLSFYSKEHGGTFHFLQFNVLYRDKFLSSTEFKHLMKFIEHCYPELENVD